KSLPALWEISGLFIEEKSEVDGGEYVYKCVCPPICEAIIKYFCWGDSKVQSTIGVLVGHLIVSSIFYNLINELINQVADSSTNWQALELLVACYFRKGAPTTISLINKDLIGKKRQQKKLHIT